VGVNTKPIRILVVEDEKKLANSIKHQLEQAHYDVDLALDGIVAEQRLQENEYSLVVLDINIPGRSGFEILESLRSHAKEVPVVIISARCKIEDRLKSFQLGSDDYLVKPFDSSELLARISAVLRRSWISHTSKLQADDLVIDVVHRTVNRGNQSIQLSPTEFKLLEFFLRNKNQILTRKRIAEQVWGYTFDTGTNIVDVYISYLRKAVDEQYNKKLIHTIHGEGFILMDK